ncbi:MAG TPA: 3-oxoacyl-ACP reductase [Gammaproteobacteria bacterium]|nr:MAG: SDR family oxidoreductase [Gammaproteobacteria bacterium TMED134]RPG46842.1 MAG: SDR family oxidoreductase [Gammaproteobacteria bacterium TMED134]RZO72752.1 MAG: SDR family oxidoreductase [OM182 bacterium]HAL41762.1 3-oxoacyl-ACP reductase [Gammaproteobacteria bacterium]HBK18033.1 3-oxoacyl-ACP reductase [Gammaproteobacteria bacterium]|tara:strand:+ start:38131 stop:38925 length:795 start_codon:yes stop_codon:yes gene_type:complete
MKDLFSVAGKVAIVTGGSRGIGEMIAAGYLSNGAKVYISSRKADVCDATAARLMENYGGECISLPADMSKIEGIEAFVEAFSQHESHLDILVNNAGVAWGAPLEEFPEIGWDKVMDTNVKGVFFLTQKLLPLLEAKSNHETPSHIVNVGSIDGIKTPVFENFSYGPSKSAVHHLTRVLAAHLIKRNILVNGIAPGPFPTYMLSTGVGAGGDMENTDWDAVGRGNPRGRVGTPEDIAGLAIFLSSRACGFTVGDIITCDGGVVVS